MDDENKGLEEEKPKVARTWMSKAYLIQVEKNLYGLYRHLEQENPDTGLREKVGKPIGPIRLLRPAKGDDQVVIRTVHPVTGQELSLCEQQE
jgi:hypothetical protein